MKEIRLWALEASEAENLRAVSVDVVRDTDTEQMLEELLVASPYLLMDRLRLIGRQVPTQCGPLDLLGLDETGRLVVFELKRGTLTREAVAQAIDPPRRDQISTVSTYSKSSASSRHEETYLTQREDNQKYSAAAPERPGAQSNARGSKRIQTETSPEQPTRVMSGTGIR